jgi:S1-C subfamily serine protease
MENNTYILIWVLVLWSCFLTVVASGDITTAPIDNVVRLTVPLAGSGTGFLLGDGRMITAKHVAEAVEMAMVANYSDGTTEFITKSQITLSDKYDIAVIEGVRKGKQLTIFDGDLSIGYPIYTLSMPFSYQIRYGSTGVVGSDRCTLQGQMLWTDVRMTDIHSVGGMSGGPIFNSDDQVVGIVVANAEVIVLMVDNKTILEFLNETEEVKAVSGD